jgi:4-carboxymuconolactone decarboxylase
MTDRNLPDDVYEESGFRLPFPRREDMDDEAGAVYDRFADPDSGTYVGLRGPGGIRLHSPKLATTMQAINRYLRYEAGITVRVRELSILVTARELDSQFEWTVHEPTALEAGVSPDVIDVVRFRGDTEGLDETDAIVIRLGRQIFGDRRVTPETFAEATRVFGSRRLIDLVSVMGNYAATAALLTTFDMQLHPGKEPLLPIP